MKKYKTFSENDLSRRLISLYIPKVIAEGMVCQVSMWVAKNGPEWTVKRLKALKTDFIQILAGNGKVSTWIKYSKGVPEGPYGRLFHYGLKNRNDNQVVARVLNALSMHTSFLSLVETEQQLAKFYGSVSADPVCDSVVEQVFGLIKPISCKLSVDSKISVRTVKDYIPAMKKRCPTSEGGTVPEKGWLNTISCIWETSLGSNLWYNYTQLREVLNPVSKVVEEKLKLPPPYLKTGNVIQSQGFAGKIGHIQEPGFKLRAVANPFRVYQLALSRLGDQLYKLVKSLPWDNTHDQEEGSDWASKKLEAGHTMFAVDLSDATNVFPLSLQMKVLCSIKHVNPEDISLLEELATAPWLSPTHGLVTWTKGQPLGLYPSFGLFTLTHGLLLRGIEHSLRTHDSFRVLGDDVIISDPRVHSMYRDILSKLEMPVSEDKTLVSDRITEYAGRIILPGATISVGKWRASGDRNFMDLLKNIGPKFLMNMRPRQRRVAEKIMSLPPPVGLGMNPKGLSAEARWELEDKLSFLYEPKYDLPLYGKLAWPSPLIETRVTQPYLFDGIPFEGNWTTSRKSFHQPAPAGSGIVELHKRLKESLGVTTLPSAQVEHCEMSYPDLLELTKRLAVVLDLVQSFTTGDPRGESALQYWERVISSGNS